MSAPSLVLAGEKNGTYRARGGSEAGYLDREQKVNCIVSNCARYLNNA